MILVREARARRRIPPLLRVAPRAERTLRGGKLCLLLEVLQLGVRLRGGGLAALLAALPLLHRVVAVQDRRERVAPGDHVLVHVLQARERGRDVVHVVDRVRAHARRRVVRVRGRVRVQVARSSPSAARRAPASTSTSTSAPAIPARVRLRRACSGP